MELTRKFIENGNGVNHLLFHFDDATNEWINSKINDPKIKLYVDDDFITSTVCKKFGTKSSRANYKNGYWCINLPNSAEMTIEFFLLRKNETNSVPLIGSGSSDTWIPLCGIEQEFTSKGVYFYTCDSSNSTYRNYIALRNDALSSTSNNYTTGTFNSSNNNYSVNITKNSDIYRCWNAYSSWLHVAITFKQLDFTTIKQSGTTGFNNQINIYINGQLVMSGYTPISTLKERYYNPFFRFGDFSYGNYGYIDELRITNKILYTGNTLTVPSSAFTY